MSAHITSCQAPQAIVNYRSLACNEKYPMHAPIAMLWDLTLYVCNYTLTVYVL